MYLCLVFVDFVVYLVAQLEHKMLFKFGGDPTIAVQSVLFAHGFTRVSVNTFV